MKKLSSVDDLALYAAFAQRESAVLLRLPRRPGSTREDYRAKYAICKQWSNLDRLLSCEVHPGTQIVVGTTQSADCGQGFKFAKTAANQVFVPNDGLAGIVHTGACTDEGAWPKAND